MKRQKNRVLAVMLVLFLMGAAAQAQTVTPSPPTLQSLQQELQRMQDMMRELERQINLQQRATQGQGQRGGGGRGVGLANPPNQANANSNNSDNLNAVRLPVLVSADGPGLLFANRVVSLQGNGAWWTNTALLTRLGLTDDQKLKIEKVYENHRQNLVATKDALEKEEAQLGKLLGADTPDRTASVAQIYKVVQARGEMEKTNSLMTFEMREVLTRAQWTQLQAQQSANGPVLILNDGKAGGGIGLRGGGGGGLGRGQQ